MSGLRGRAHIVVAKSAEAKFRAPAAPVMAKAANDNTASWRIRTINSLKWMLLILYLGFMICYFFELPNGWSIHLFDSLMTTERGT